MTYRVKTRVFEGPLDLLLQLITTHQVEITELSLSDIVTEYLESLDAMRSMDLEVTSEFLLIAATLVQLKARHLLPGDRPVDLDEELALAEERDRLLARLLACLTFKDVAAVLAHRIAANDRHVPRSAGLEPGIHPAPPDFALPVDAAGLAAIAFDVLHGDEGGPDVDHLDLELPSIRDVMVDLQVRMAATVETDFDEIVASCTRAVDVVAYFLAMLELSRWGIVHVSQEARDAPIVLAYDEDAAGSTLSRALTAAGEGN
jgi:segregation and condensation protein A